jgi:hypothetical protein
MYYIQKCIVFISFFSSLKIGMTKFGMRPKTMKVVKYRRCNSFHGLRFRKTNWHYIHDQLFEDVMENEEIQPCKSQNETTPQSSSVRRCVICLISPPKMLYIKCGHYAVCAECHDVLDKEYREKLKRFMDDDDDNENSWNVHFATLDRRKSLKLNKFLCLRKITSNN